MSVCLEVVCPGAAETGATLVLCGGSAELGAWEVSKGVPLLPVPLAPASDKENVEPTASSQPTFACKIAVPEKESEWNLVLASASGEKQLESLPQKRKWPSEARTGLCDGTTFRTTFGEARMTVKHGQAYIHAQARKSRDITQRQGSALQDNLEHKGDLAYYQAHNRAFEVPDHATVVTGTGIINGGEPMLIEVGAESIDSGVAMQLNEYYFADSKDKVKVYIAIKAGVLPSSGAAELVKTDFKLTGVDLSVNTKPRYRFKLDKLNAEIEPEDSKTRVEPEKNRIVLQLAKKRGGTWDNLTKK